MSQSEQPSSGAVTDFEPVDTVHSKHEHWQQLANFLAIDRGDFQSCTVQRSPHDSRHHGNVPTDILIGRIDAVRLGEVFESVQTQ